MDIGDEYGWKTWVWENLWMWWYLYRVKEENYEWGDLLSLNLGL